MSEIQTEIPQEALEAIEKLEVVTPASEEVLKPESETSTEQSLTQSASANRVAKVTGFGVHGATSHLPTPQDVIKYSFLMSAASKGLKTNPKELAYAKNVLSSEKLLLKAYSNYNEGFMGEPQQLVPYLIDKNLYVSPLYSGCTSSFNVTDNHGATLRVKRAIRGSTTIGAFDTSNIPSNTPLSKADQRVVETVGMTSFDANFEISRSEVNNMYELTGDMLLQGFTENVQANIQEIFEPALLGTGGSSKNIQGLLYAFDTANSIDVSEGCTLEDVDAYGKHKYVSLSSITGASQDSVDDMKDLKIFHRAVQAAQEANENLRNRGELTNYTFVISQKLARKINEIARFDAVTSGSQSNEFITTYDPARKTLLVGRTEYQCIVSTKFGAEGNNAPFFVFADLSNCFAGIMCNTQNYATMTGSSMGGVYFSHDENRIKFTYDFSAGFFIKDYNRVVVGTL